MVDVGVGAGGGGHQVGLGPAPVSKLAYTDIEIPARLEDGSEAS